MREMSDMELLSKLEGDLAERQTLRYRLGAERSKREELVSNRGEQTSNEQVR